MDGIEVFWPLMGGLLIGLSATLLLALDGKVLGVSGIVGGLIDGKATNRPWRWSFILGILTAGFLIHRIQPQAFGASPASNLGLIGAGLLVGFGTRLGNGCTSGHGVCGISRFSPRSIVATLTFMATGVLTAWIIYR